MNAQPPPEVTRAVLICAAWNADLRVAGLHAISQLSRGSKRRQSRIPTQQIELHLVFLSPPGPSSSTSSSEASYSRSIVLSVLREAGATVVVHFIPFATYRISLSTSTSNIRSALIGQLSQGSLNDVVNKGIESFGIVWSDENSCDDSMMEEVTGAVLDHLASRLVKATAGVERKVLPKKVVVYLSTRVGSSDFDTDLPVEEVRAARIVEGMGEKFQSSLRFYQATILQQSSSNLGESTTDRRHSSDGVVPRSLSSNRCHTTSNVRPPTSTLRPLLLRPAPILGSQSIFTHVQLPPSYPIKELVLAVVEAPDSESFGPRV